ncbi:hypothetical protein [Limnoraphis robusta]|uniref:Ribbon-helix-helix protein CopG domain-containing protein n=1 Tax=Limnoraphis robusta CCNP1315 TaxID=3110306 RepID=A0ABU5U531_9CYAN|nr:hypothetical protein [Limnoraphis robusta]MEA5497954.1 hypothetical protein [Limnoraphis robusta BA-68 BA1]MEA5522105.1 hypothetical protein [Limnoraphis robusta CCNP1315]MEA5544191.1 hypothetical protein [Limnoraphis robusta CCNP1324]
MPDNTLSWNPDPTILDQLLILADQRHQSVESLITEAVKLYIQEQLEVPDLESDPLVGLFAGSPNLASDAENKLQQEMTQTSGWTWKNP